MLETIKLLLGLRETEKDSLLQHIIDLTKTKVMNYCKIAYIPEELEPVIIELAVLRYNQLGSEGLASESYSGISQAWLQDFPADIKKQLNMFRRVKVL